jgi:gluconolactonase
MTNPNGGYYYKGWVYMVYFGNLTTNPGIARVNAETYETEFLLNNYFGLPFNGPDDIVVLSANHDNNGVETDHIYFTDNTYGGLVAKPDSVYALPNAVWRFTPATGALVPVISRADIVGANGIRTNVNGTKLYVGELDSLTSGLDIGVE